MTLIIIKSLHQNNSYLLYSFSPLLLILFEDSLILVLPMKKTYRLELFKNVR